jgi:hypothetical protein
VTSAGVGANPDGFLPALAANAMGLQAFAETTIEEWQNQLRQGVVTASTLLSAAIHQLLGSLADFAEQIPLIGPTIAAVIMGFEGSLETLATWFADLQSVLGNPTGLGTGSPVVGALASIPILGPIAVLVGQLIDAIVNALGFVGSGFSLVNLQTYLGGLNTAVDGAVAQLLQLFSSLGSAFPKAFPFTFGASTNLTLSPPVALSEFQQLLDGIAQQANASVAAAVGALHGNTAAVQASVSQAIVDGVNAVNTAETAVAAAVNGVTSTAVSAGVNAQGLIEGVNNAAAGVLAGASDLVEDAQTNFALLLQAPAQFLQGLLGTFGIQATQNAYANAAAARAAQAAEQARITSAFNAVFNVNPTTAGNVSQTIDFTPMSDAATMAGVPMSPGTTHMGITSGAAAQQAGATSGVFDAEVFTTQTVTDYQAITATLGPLNDLASGQAGTYLIGRVNSARDTYIYAFFSTSQVNLVAVVSGVATQFAGATVPGGLSTGGALKLILGDPSSSSPYAMQVLYNGTPVITYSDSSHVSSLGSSYRYVGLQMISTNPGFKFPPAIRTVNYQDNPPPPTSYPHSGRPTAGTKGRLWVPNDVGLIQRDNSAAWETIWAGTLGTLTDPPSTSWSWINQGTATTATELGGERITALTSTRSWRLRTRTLTPSSNYTATAYLEAAGKSAINSWWTGIGLRNSSSGSFVMFGPVMLSTGVDLVVSRWTDATTFSATQILPNAYALSGGCIPNWLRIRDDGSNRYFDYSFNGVDWTLLFSEGRTTFITPDQFFFGADNEATGVDLTVRLRSLTGIS